MSSEIPLWPEMPGILSTKFLHLSLEAEDVDEYNVNSDSWLEGCGPQSSERLEAESDTHGGQDHESRGAQLFQEWAPWRRMAVDFLFNLWYYNTFSFEGASDKQCYINIICLR